MDRPPAASSTSTKAADGGAASLRVAQVAPVIFPVPPADHGGTERVVYDLCAALRGMDVEVTLFASADSATDPPGVDVPRPDAPRPDSLPSQPPRTGLRRVGALPSLAALERAHGRVPPGVPAVLEAARLEDLRRHLPAFDLVHAHGEFAHAALLGERRPRSLTTIHWRVDELDRRLFFEAFPDLPVAAISAAQAAALPASNRAGIVHHGIARDRYRLGSGAGGYLAFVGRMTDQKRPDRAIRIARAAGWPIRLAGTIDVGNPRYFEREVAPLLADDAVYVGPLGDVAKGALLADAAALLFPIDWPEPFGLVMIEAMACGTPVVGWRRGSVPEVVEDGVTGFVVDGEAEAVAALARVPSLDRARVRRRFEARFTAERMAGDYLAIYRRLLAA